MTHKRVVVQFECGVRVKRERGLLSMFRVGLKRIGKNCSYGFTGRAIMTLFVVDCLRNGMLEKFL